MAEPQEPALSEQVLDPKALEHPATYANLFSVIGTLEVVRIVFGDNYPGSPQRFHTAVAVSPDGARKLMDVLAKTLKQYDEVAARSKAESEEN